MFKFEVKFINFSSNFTRRNPRFENIKFSRYRAAGLSDKICHNPAAAAKFNAAR